MNTPLGIRRAGDEVQREEDRISHADLLSDLIEAWTRFDVQPMTLDVLMPVLDIMRHGLSYWDRRYCRSGAGARLPRGSRTEDMHHGLAIDGLRLINPFL